MKDRVLKVARSFALVLTIALFAGCAAPKREPVALRVMNYNIQHGAGLDKKVDLLRLSQAINQEHPDIVALEEVDKGVARTDQRDLTSELTALTKLTGYFSNNFHFQGGEYGNAVLTRFPILQSTNTHYVMTHSKEQRGVIQLILDVHGRRVLFMATHVDYRAENAERLLNVAELKTILPQYHNLPTILCGDFNDYPEGQVHTELKKSFDDTWELIGQGEGLTFPSDKPKVRIDYIWISKDKSIVPLKAWVPVTEASDHRPLVADLELVK